MTCRLPCLVAALAAALCTLTAAPALADASCLRMPFLASTWNTSGKSGGACRISSPYGWRNLNGRKFHGGVDFSCKEGTAIIAPVAGVAYHESFSAGGPHVVQIKAPGIVARLGKDVRVGFLHSRQWSVGDGQAVSPGDPISMLGNMGHSTGAHLHLQVAGGLPRTSVDPASLACPGTWPSAGPMDAAGDPSSSDAHAGTARFGETDPNETPPPPPQGLGEGSRIEDLSTDIMVRAFNPEYTKQLGSLGTTSLVRELAYMDALESRMAVMKAQATFRRESLSAGMLALRARKLRPAIDQQRARATRGGNSTGAR